MTPRLRTVTSGLRIGSRLVRRPVLVEQEVEPPHLVRAVVRAVARADAAVVDHVVQAFSAVGRGGNRADDLARRVLALHAGYRLMVGLDRGVEVVAGEVVIDANPVHLASVGDLLLADDRDVVFGDAGNRAGAAAGARRQVDRHRPTCSRRKRGRDTGSACSAASRPAPR